jgi:hypothetical protein
MQTFRRDLKASPSTFLVETACTSDILVNFSPTAWHNVPKENSPQIEYIEELRPCLLTLIQAGVNRISAVTGIKAISSYLVAYVNGTSTLLPEYKNTSHTGH